MKTNRYNGKDAEGEPVENMGEVIDEQVDGCNVMFGNPYDKTVNKNGKAFQPWIVIAFKKMTTDVQQEAKKNGVTNWKEIGADKENDDYQFGDAA